MILEYIHTDNSKEIINLDLNVKTTDEWIRINANDKLEFIKKFLPSFHSGQKIVLFDTNHKQLLKFYEENDINNLNNIQTVNKNSKLLFFTSGSTGFPVGAFKSSQNLEEEILVLSKLVKSYNIKKVVVTVPFIHIYGVLAGLLLPLYLDNITLVVKDDFLPYELLEEAKAGQTLIITTPVFIKALERLGDGLDLKTNLFICSTAPLHLDDINSFEDKFNTNLMQIFGSTETGGIAYKFGSAVKWSTLENVKVTSKDDKLCVNSPFISPYILNEKILKLEQPFVTEDIIDLSEHGFILLGRSNKIIKIAGKRISALQIESILEDIEGVNKAIVELVYKKELLRSEQIIITLESTKKILKQEIKKKISEYYGVLTIPFSVKYADKINLSAMGKKVLF